MPSLAERIMRSAARKAPTDRSVWAKAMQSEYAELKRGQLSWALGCWLAVMGWRLRADLGYFVALGVMAVGIPTVGERSFFLMLVTIQRWVPRETFYLVGMLAPALACFALGVYRPNRLVTTVAVTHAVGLTYTLMVFAGMGRPFHSPMDVLQHLHIMDLPFALGYSIWLVTDFACAWLGGRLRLQFAPTAS